MVSPGTHLVKNHESRPEPLSPSSKNNKFYTENAWVVCNQAVTESEDRLQNSLSQFTEIDI